VKADGTNRISALVDQIPVFIPLSAILSGRFGEISGLGPVQRSVKKAFTNYLQLQDE
jgi:hypothetical protein